MDSNDPIVECEVCGGTDFHKESGHFYCNECQTQSQQVRDQVFDREEATVNKRTTKNIQKSKTQKADDQLTSWECYNIILKGLTEELISLGAKPQLKLVVRSLWMKYLHKCEVFDIHSNRPPKVSILGSKKDIAILYNVKKRKRRRSRTSSVSTTLSVKRQQSKRKRALVQSQYEELSQSQSLTQGSSMMDETLSGLKSGSEKSSTSEKIRYNRYSDAQLKRMMSKKHYKEHKEDLASDMSCHKFHNRDFSQTFSYGPTVLTCFTLYSILYIGLIIVEDVLQLSDLFRFIREGHLSFYSYRHFFDEDVSDQSLNLPRKNDKLFSGEFFRKKTAKLVHFLGIEQYIKKPNIVEMCSRYCTELNLPREIFECAEKLIAKTEPQMKFDKKSPQIPNYEGRAMSFIIFTLKLLFSLDGVTEMKFSKFAAMLNDIQIGRKMFNFANWLQYIGYREKVVTTYHMPSWLENCHNINSDFYLNYLKSQEINFKSASRHVQNEAKDYLQVFEKLLDEDDFLTNHNQEIKFKHSLTPYLTYTQFILNKQEISCENVLKQVFSDESITFLLRPNLYLKLVGNQSVHNGGANDNIISEDYLHLYKKTETRQKYKNIITVKLSDDDRLIKECLDGKPSLKTEDVVILLSNWQKGNQKQFLKNQVLLELASEQVNVTVKKETKTGSYVEHFNAFERYWLNIPANPTLIRYFSKNRMQEIMGRVPYSFKMILKECARIIEQEIYDLYAEFLITELNLVYFDGYCSKNKKNNGRPELRKVITDCKQCW